MPERVTVELGNDVKDPVVRDTLAGLGSLMGAFVEAGRDEWVHREEYAMSGFETLIDRVNEGLLDPDLWAHAEANSPGILATLETVRQGLEDENGGLKKYINELSSLDTMHSLRAEDDAQPHRLTLRIFGID